VKFFGWKYLDSVMFFFYFCREMLFRVYGVKISKDGLYACVVRIKDVEDIVDIAEKIYDCVLVC